MGWARKIICWKKMSLIKAIKSKNRSLGEVGKITKINKSKL